MSAAHALTGLALCVFLHTARAQQAPDAAQPVPATPSPAAALDARLARWSESLDLDLPDEVLRDGRALVAKDGALAKDARAIALVSRALAATGLAQEAHQLLDLAAGATPAENIVAESARLALEEDDLDGVLALLWDNEKKVLRTPATNEAWLIAGRARTRRGEWDLALPLIQRFLELEPRSAQAAGAWHLLGVEASRRQDGQRTLECAKHEEALGRWHSYFRARLLQVRENPREPLPRLGLAQLWLEAGDAQRARAVLDELLAIAPDFARAWLALGETQRKQDDIDGARKSYDRALELDASLDIARYNRAVIARLQGRDDDARDDLEKMLGGGAGRDPRFAGAHLDLARLYTKLGDKARAAAAFARYQALGGKEKL